MPYGMDIDLDFTEAYSTIDPANHFVSKIRVINSGSPVLPNGTPSGAQSQQGQQPQVSQSNSQPNSSQPNIESIVERLLANPRFKQELSNLVRQYLR